MENKSFFRMVCNLAIPVALQAMLQASFSIIDQIMIGQLGSVSVAAVGLAGKFSSIFTFVVSAIGAVAGIMISQYLGQKNQREVRRSFWINLVFMFLLAAFFCVVSLLFPSNIMGFYSKEADTVLVAADYLRIISGTYIPMAGATILATLFRCMEKASKPLYATIVAACINTCLNYIFIFGKLGLEPMGASGAAVATVISQIANFGIMLIMFIRNRAYLYEGDRSEEKKKIPKHISESVELETNAKERKDDSDRFNWKQYGTILLPILSCEILWCLGENVYTAIYGHLGTDACAAMMLLNPVQGLLIGAMSGLASAAGIIIGKQLGQDNFDQAYKNGRKLMIFGLIGSVILSLIVLLINPVYHRLYDVNDTVRALTQQIMIAYAIIAPVKVLNMISGGVIKSGGRTKYVLIIDIIGTWGLGVPFGLISAFVWGMPIPLVYFILSLEECVRLCITLFVFKKKWWMYRLKA